LVKRSFDEQELAAVEIGCGKWTCEDCARKLRARVKASVLRGNPNKFLTITVNPEVGASSLDRREMLADAWKRLSARIKRYMGWKKLDYYVVVEATDAGEPHFHIALRCGYIDQRWLSEQMREMIGAPIVDIRRIKHIRGAARYLAKYLAKEPGEWEHKRRCWPSHGWAVKPARKPSFIDPIAGYWSRVKCSLEDYARYLVRDELTVFVTDGRTFYAGTPEAARKREADIDRLLSARGTHGPPQGVARPSP